jgi:hypothetical protein
MVFGAGFEEIGVFHGRDGYFKGRAQNPSATLSGENVAWEETTSS